ncbi:hypothetical protein P9112_004268 [Eukaryota sp. TZLM1-RC]
MPSTRRTRSRSTSKKPRKVEEDTSSVEHVSLPETSPVEDPTPSNLETEQGAMGSSTETSTTTTTPSNDSSIFTPVRFDSLDISEKIKQSLSTMGMEVMTKIQAQSLAPSLSGKDILGSARTGSGKTLAFLLPALEILHRGGFNHRHGTAVLILSPTRELALQIYGVARDLLTGFSHTHGLVMGGANRNVEADKLRKGVNLVVGTPGRVLDHLNNTEGFNYSRLSLFVVDEADRCLDVGFEQEMKSIIKKLPRDRQTLFFSATQTDKVNTLAKLALRPKEVVYVGVDDNRDEATVDGLEQGYVVCPGEMRLLLLFTFLRKNKKKKVIVFFSTCAAVAFYSELFNYIDFPVMALHGKQKQQKRTQTFFSFINAESGILLCTDVAARGLDIPSVDWILQYDPPDDPREYIHRVGRTGRGGNNAGKALLFLMPSELEFLKFLKKARVPLFEFELPKNKLQKSLQLQIERLVSKNFALHKSARDGFRAYIQAYASHSLKNVFDVNSLDLVGVAKGFGFQTPPAVDLSVFAGKKGKSKGKRPGMFSADNPYGK